MEDDCINTNHFKENRSIQIEKTIIVTNTQFITQGIILRSIVLFYDVHDRLDISKYSGSALVMLHHQNAIGWINFVRNRILEVFTSTIQHNYKKIARKKNL